MPYSDDMSTKMVRSLGFQNIYLHVVQPVRDLGALILALLLAWQSRKLLIGLGEDAIVVFVHTLNMSRVEGRVSPKHLASISEETNGLTRMENNVSWTLMQETEAARLWKAQNSRGRGMRRIMNPSNEIGCVVYSAVVQKQLDQRRMLSGPKGWQRVSTLNSGCCPTII